MEDEVIETKATDMALFAKLRVSLFVDLNLPSETLDRIEDLIDEIDMVELVKTKLRSISRDSLALMVDVRVG